MARKHVAFTWQILADDAEADAYLRKTASVRAENLPLPTPATCPARRWWGTVGLALVVAVVVGYRLYGVTQAGVATLESELQEAIVLESYMAANPAVAAEQTPPALLSFDLRNGVAAAAVVVHDPSRPSPYRETRFYRETENGWQPTTKATGFWSSRQQLESEHFVFHFPHRDYAAVLAAAPALDTVYAALHRDLGRIMPDAGKKLTVEIVASYGLEGQGLRAAAPDSIWVPSPGLLQIPVDVSDAEVLAMSVTVRLIHRLLPKVSADWRTNENRSAGWWWSPLTEGLRLWLLWDNDPLSARWRHDILTWFLTDSCQPCSGESAALPAGFREFCQTVSTAGSDLLNLYIAFPCSGYWSDTEHYVRFPPVPPAHLSMLSAFSPGTSTRRLEASQLQTSYGEQVVSMATLLEYVAATYEREQIPVFLDAFGTYQRWDALVEAVFGVSTEQFEAGWHAYLMEQYGRNQP